MIHLTGTAPRGGVSSLADNPFVLHSIYDITRGTHATADQSDGDRYVDFSANNDKGEQSSDKKRPGQDR